jgi:hypothetical protein
MSPHRIPSPDYRPLPEEALRLCAQVSAPPRLIAHLTLVHDAACTLIERLQTAFPTLPFDEDQVGFGAATHDLGKAIHTSELTESGQQHQARGMSLLEGLGVPRERARFALTHGHWDEPGNDALEDLLVALADKCWRGRRVERLEALIVERLSLSTGEPAWSCMAKLDQILTSFAKDAEAKLAWQRSFPLE